MKRNIPCRKVPAGPARNGVKLQVLPSAGSVQNLERLNDPSFNVDLGFVQGDLATGPGADKLMSVGGAFADEFYVLREHIRFVRDRLASATAANYPGTGSK